MVDREWDEHLRDTQARGADKLVTARYVDNGAASHVTDAMGHATALDILVISLRLPDPSLPIPRKLSFVDWQSNYLSFEIFSFFITMFLSVR